MTLPRALVPGEYYHVYNRAAGKRTVFRDTRDYARFLFALVYGQSPVQFPQLGRLARTFTQQAGFEVPNEDFLHVIESRYVELVSFCIMPNHFHLLVRELEEGGVPRYMQRVGDGYTKYVHAKYQESGHVFQGRYQARHVPNNEYLMHLSAYIHRNPRELKAWKGREAEYPWSSYQDYTKENRWGGLLAQEIILDQFAGTKESNYADYIKTSPAKGLEFEI